MLLNGIAALSLVLAVAVCLCAEWTLWLLPVLFAAAYAAGLLLAFAFLCIVCALVDMDKPQEEDSKFYRIVMNLYIEAIISLAGLKVDTAGLEKTPKDGRFLLVCNHQSDADPGILMHYFRKSQMAFISKKENANMFIVNKFMHKTLCQLVNRENDREALKTIIKCIQLIKEDKVSIGAFPEGGIKEKDKLNPFRSGMFKIALKANVPIVVCTLKDTSDVVPNLMRLRRSRCRLHLLDVIPVEELKGKTTVEIADRVYRMMLNDLGPEYAMENV